MFKLTYIITLVPKIEEFPRMCGHEDQAMKEVSRGWQLNEDVSSLIWVEN